MNAVRDAKRDATAFVLKFVEAASLMPVKE